MVVLQENRDRSIKKDTSGSIMGDTLIIPNEEYSELFNVKNDTSRKNTLLHDDPNLRHGFTQIPNVILTDKRLSAQECRLYCVLLKYSWQEGKCFPGQEQLSVDINCKPLTIKRTIKRLRLLKLIRIKRIGQGRHNIYFIRRLQDAYPAFHDRG